MSSVAQQASLPKVAQELPNDEKKPDSFFQVCIDGNLKLIIKIIAKYHESLKIHQSLCETSLIEGLNPWIRGLKLITLCNKIDILKYLLESEQYLHLIRQYKIRFHTFKEMYEYVYEMACAAGNYDIVKFILESEKDINFNIIYTTVRKSKITAFSVACKWKHSNVIKLLLESNKAIDYDFTYIHLLDFSDKEFKKLVFDKMLNKLAAEQESNKQLEIKVAEIYDDFCTVQEENESLKRKWESSDDDSNKKSRA